MSEGSKLERRAQEEGETGDRRGRGVIPGIDGSANIMPSCCRQPCCAAQSNTGVAGGGRRALCDCWLVTRSCG